MAIAQVGAQTYSNTALTEVKVAALAAGTNIGYLLFNILATNTHATDPIYVQFFDLASGDVTVGGTTPTFVLAVPAQGTTVLATSVPKGFRTAVTIACTATPTGAGAPAANGVMNFDYTSG